MQFYNYLGLYLLNYINGGTLLKYLAGTLLPYSSSSGNVFHC